MTYSMSLQDLKSNVNIGDEVWSSETSSTFAMLLMMIFMQ